jgi:hypothetical protein
MKRLNRSRFLVASVVALTAAIGSVPWYGLPRGADLNALWGSTDDAARVSCNSGF